MRDVAADRRDPPRRCAAVVFDQPTLEAPMSGSRFGVPGLEFDPGDHICAMYLGTGQRDEFLIPYLRSGLLAGDKCICVQDSRQDAEMRAVLGSELDLDGYLRSEQLEMKGAADTYLTGHQFVPGDLLTYWEAQVSSALSGGTYTLARVAGEMPALLRTGPGIDSFMSYESELNEYVPRYAQVLLCMYDLSVFGGGIIPDLMRTHPRVLLGGMVLDNPHFLPPDSYREWRAARSPIA
jgi:MEDS: MEthanogen/methylotroph, DcmR Sensory domain